MRRPDTTSSWLETHLGGVYSRTDFRRLSSLLRSSGSRPPFLSASELSRVDAMSVYSVENSFFQSSLLFADAAKKLFLIGAHQPSEGGGKMGDTISSNARPPPLPEDAAPAPMAGSGGEIGDKNPLDVSKLPTELTSKYEVLEKIGFGSFGSVYKVRRLDSKALYAAKYVESKDSTAAEVWTTVEYVDIKQSPSPLSFSFLPPSPSPPSPLPLEKVKIQANLDDEHVVKI